MPILAIGSKRIESFDRPSSSRRALVSIGNSEAGFTLVEILVAIVVMAIILAVAVLAIPNHDDRYWRDNLDQLVASLNLAQEESTMSGTPMIVQIDSTGWRFFISNASGSGAYGTSLMGQTATAPGQLTANTSGLLPDVYRTQSWYKPVEMAPVQLTLGGEQVAQVLQIPIQQARNQGNSQPAAMALLMRNRNGRFSWVKS